MSILNKIGLGLPIDGKGMEADFARSSQEWHDFEVYHKKHNPIRYFLNHEFESIFIWPWSMQISRLIDWVKYRTTKRYHVVNTGMEPGYADASERMLHVNFNMLKDFVEIEKAHMWNHGDQPKMEQPGVSHLVWEMGLESDASGQAENAREIYELYDWWTNVRPYRVDDNVKDWEVYRAYSEEIYGGSDDYFMRGDKDDKKLKKLRKTWLDKSDKIEKKNSKEDEAMLIRLMKVRGALWT